MTGIVLGFVICMALVLVTESNGDPESITGVASVFPETGSWPYAHARANFHDIDAGVPELRETPILTALVGGAFAFFGSGVATLKLFSVVPFLICMLLIAMVLAKRRGEGIAVLGALVLALQPTFLPWSSVPNTVPLAALSILCISLLAGGRWKFAPHSALLLCGVLWWGLGPLVLVAAPACWLELIRRELPRRLRPKGWTVTLVVAAVLLSLQQLGADAVTLATGLTGSTDLFRPGEVPSILLSDPGWLIAVVAALIAGPRGRDSRFRPLRMTLVAGVLPWIMAGQLPVFPLVVLMPMGVLLALDLLAERGRTLLTSVAPVGKSPQVALTLFFVAILLVAAFASAMSASAAVRIAISLGLSTAAVGIVLAIRSGLNRSHGIGLAAATTVALCLPLNLYRIAHEPQHWERSIASLERIVPAGVGIGGRWAHALVCGSNRPATVALDTEHVILARGQDVEGLVLENYALFGQQQSLLRQRGVPVGTFEVACALQQSGQRSEARADLALLLRADPACSAAWERFAIILLEDGIEDLAAECLFFALQGDPERSSSHRLLAQMYATQGMMREAHHHMVMSGAVSKPLALPLLAPAAEPSPSGRR